MTGRPRTVSTTRRITPAPARRARRSAPRIGLGLLSGFSLVAGLLLPGGPIVAQVVAASPTVAHIAIPPTSGAAALVAGPMAVDLGFDLGPGQPVDLLPVGDRLWISHGDQVSVHTGAGAVLANLTLPAAGGLALAPDGDRVLVAGADGITGYDPVAGTAVATWATQPCPRDPTPLADRLLYAFGCPGTGPYGVAALDPVTGAPVPSGVAAWSGAPPRLLTAAGLLVTLEGGAPTTVRSYLSEADGALTLLATEQLGEVVDAALAPDASELLVAEAGSSTVTRLETSDLVPNAGTPVGSAAAAVAFDPDGGTFAAGLAGSTVDQVLVHEQARGALVSRSAQRSAAAGAANPAPLPGTMVYSADGSRIFALTRPPGGHATLLIATSGPVSPTVVSVQATSPNRFGDPLNVRVSVPGRPAAPVHLALVDAGGRYPHDDVTDAAGVLQIGTDADLNGRVTVLVDADLTHAAASAVDGFTVPAALHVDLVGYRSKRKGVLHFRSFGAVQGLVSGLPSRSLKVSLQLQQLTRRGWRPSTPTQAAWTDRDGLLAVSVGQFQRSVAYRLVVRFSGDRRNTAAPAAYSLPFVVG